MRCPLEKECFACRAGLACVAGVAHHTEYIADKHSVIYVGTFPYLCQIMKRISEEDVPKCPLARKLRGK